MFQLVLLRLNPQPYKVCFFFSFPILLIVQSQKVRHKLHRLREHRLREHCLPSVKGLQQNGLQQWGDILYLSYLQYCAESGNVAEVFSSQLLYIFCYLPYTISMKWKSEEKNIALFYSLVVDDDLNILEVLVRYVGFFLDPAEGFGLWSRLFLPFVPKKSFSYYFCPNFGIFW